MNHKVGLVLAGGGGKGAYHIGVWKAFREFGVDSNITIVSGTSVGALNAALFLQGDYGVAERLWLTISRDKILTTDSSQLISKLLALGVSRRLISGSLAALGWTSNKVKRGMFSREGLVKIIRQHVNLNVIAASPIPCYITCCRIPSLQPKYFQLNCQHQEKITSILLASSALPVIFEPQEIDGRQYIDGGVTDNLPVQPLYDAGCRHMFVVHLGREGVIDHSKFPGANIVEIVPQEHQGNMVTGTLDFTAAGAKMRIDQGYRDAVKILRPIYEMSVVQKKMGQALTNIANDEQQFRAERQQILNQRQLLKNQLAELLSEHKGGPKWN